jgi:general secretion pathway protein J
MLVALGVFAVLGAMSTQMVSRILAVHETATTRGERLAEIERAMGMLERDLIEITARGVRDGMGDALPALQVGAGPLFELTRTGHRNPLGEKRSELQRVAYVLEDGTLYRYYWAVLDRAEDSLPIVQTLLTHVDSAEASVVDVSGNEHSTWPPVGDEAGDPAGAIAGMKIALSFAPFGEIVRLWDLPQGEPRTATPAQAGEESPAT